jgi:cytochrome b561
MTVHPLETGHAGPDSWIRIRHRFRTRVTEWLLALVTALWGVIILLPGDTFDQPAFSGFRSFFGNEDYLGALMLILGLLRIAGLFVNGARRNVTPHVRMVSAACGCLIFFGICYCYMLSGIVSTWLAIYPPFVLAELVNAYRAAHDVGENYGRTH